MSQSKRLLDRYVASCAVSGCDFDRRKEPRLHERAAPATEESQDHAVKEGHVKAKKVKLERVYETTVVSERLVS